MKLIVQQLDRRWFKRVWRWERDCGDAELMGEELCVYSVTC
jgi:hypothetical protein